MFVQSFLDQSCTNNYVGLCVKESNFDHFVFHVRRNNIFADESTEETNQRFVKNSIIVCRSTE